MTSIFLRLGTTALLSISSFIVVLFRLSPLSSPGLALPLFFITLFFAITSTVSLASYFSWSHWSEFDAGKCLSIALREGVFLAIATCVIIILHILGVLSWWIGILLYLTFIFIELALLS